ncbi:Uncharacterised protein [Mycobacteroides abscessus subsp. abscessus]|uniref:hypothetical protein n=1 Tax=Mycobacteroides abscessus TaxID=36809 RepID=UPI0009268D35|nr:hypothetical protein [Mycobacteroides abscessus]SHQ41305.1 Uncharacterised protein [Mycobacteroides abscessus subsp. abscessus]
MSWENSLRLILSAFRRTTTLAAEAPDGTRIVTLYDRTDHQRATPLLVLTVGKTDDVTIDTRQLRKFLAQ